MEQEWAGKAVSIECNNKLGVFQGIISQCTPSEITIIRTFRNGVPTRNQSAEVTLRSADIQRISLLPISSSNGSGTNPMAPTINNKTTLIKPANVSLVFDNVSSDGSQPSENNGNSKINNIGNRMLNEAKSANHLGPVNDNMEDSSSNCINKLFGNLIPSKVEVKFGPRITNPLKDNNKADIDLKSQSFHGVSSKPIDIVVGNCNKSSYEQQQQNNVKSSRNSNGSCSTNGSINGSMNGSAGNRNKHRNNKQLRRDIFKQRETFDTNVDDPELNEDFDFEGNLALFDKQAVWNSLNSGKKPDLVQHAVAVQQSRRQQKPQKNYRHDENILVSEPTQMRQIESLFDGSQDYITDEGLIIPSIPPFVRTKIEMCAEKCGYLIQRQIDLLARGTTDLALLLLGGARRLTPKNSHQWPTIVIICEKSHNFRTSNLGATIGRQLASLGPKVLLYLDENPAIEQKSIEVSLFKSTSNAIIYTVDALPTPDLVILSTNSIDISNHVRKWLSENRASILAVDPPPTGIKDVHIKHAILPILPLNGMSSEHYGKLYLCNLCIPDKFYRDAGVKYKSPFGHKFVIPIHTMH